VSHAAKTAVTKMIEDNRSALLTWVREFNRLGFTTAIFFGIPVAIGYLFLERSHFMVMRSGIVRSVTTLIETVAVPP